MTVGRNGLRPVPSATAELPVLASVGYSRPLPETEVMQCRGPKANRMNARAALLVVALFGLEVNAQAECVPSPKSLRYLRVPSVTGQLWIHGLGAPIPNGTVELRRRGAIEPLRAATDEQGFFSFAGVAAGDYALGWNAEGFQTGTLRITVDRQWPPRVITIAAVLSGDQGTCTFVCAVALPSPAALRQAPKCLTRR